MTRENMAQMLSETIKVTPEAATAALEASAWDVLKAADLLQLEQRKSAIASSARARQSSGTIADAVRGLFARLGRRNLATAK